MGIDAHRQRLLYGYKPIHVGMCLGVAAASTSDGALVNLWSLDDADAAAGGTDQQYAFVAS